MKNLPNHATAHIGKGISTYAMLRRISKSDSLENFLQSPYSTAGDKLRFWGLSRLQALVVMVEHALIHAMYKEFNQLNQPEMETVKCKVAEQANHSYSKRGAWGHSELAMQLDGAEEINIMSPWILQAFAGFSLGGLIALAESHFTFTAGYIEDLRGFNRARNDVIHNSASSSQDIDKRLDDGINLAAELLQVLEK